MRSSRATSSCKTPCRALDGGEPLDAAGPTATALRDFLILREVEPVGWGRDGGHCGGTAADAERRALRGGGGAEEKSQSQRHAGPQVEPVDVIGPLCYVWYVQYGTEKGV